MPQITVIVHNIRSTHNVGSIFRTCEGFGVEHIILSGYTPYPTVPGDPRLPHIHNKLTSQIHKTALGAEELVSFEYQPELETTIQQLASNGYTIIGLEQDMRAHPINEYTPPEKIALWLGEEVEGMTPDQRALCNDLIEIPMHGKKESFNVSVAAGIALYALTYPPK